MPFKRSCATAVFILLCFGSAFASDAPARSLRSNFVFSQPPAPAPDLLFNDGKGQELALLSYMKNNLKGRYVLLNVWATWCAPCLSEMASLDKLQAIMETRHLAVIALSQDREGKITVPAFYRRHGLSHLKVYLDPHGSAVRRLKLRGLPTSILLNPKGEEIGRIARPIDWAQQDNLVFLDGIVGR